MSISGYQGKVDKVQKPGVPKDAVPALYAAAFQCAVSSKCVKLI